MNMLYTLPVNRLPVFLLKEEGSTETFSVRIDQWIAGDNHHPGIRFVILESLVGDHYRYAVAFPQEVALLRQVTFMRSDGKNQMRSQFPFPKTGELKSVGFWHVNRKGERVDFLYAREYLLYEQQTDGKWMAVGYDGKKLLL